MMQAKQNLKFCFQNQVVQTNLVVQNQVGILFFFSSAPIKANFFHLKLSYLFDILNQSLNKTNLVLSNQRLNTFKIQFSDFKI